MGRSRGWSGSESRAERNERIREELEEKRRDLDDIDGEINWAYSQMRVIEAWLEGAIERNEALLSDKDQKRIDKAIIVTRTGLKMLKKVVKSRAPYLDTAAWKAETEGVIQ